MEYRGFETQPEFDGEIYFGKLEGISDLVTIESDTLEDFEREFESAVDDYLQFRQELRQRDRTPYVTRSLFSNRLRRIHERKFA